MPSDFLSKFNAQTFTGPYEYLCVDPPEWAEEDDAANEGDEDSGIESDGSNSEADFFKEPAADHPTHKWILMREGLDLLVQNCHETMQRNPDNYGMHVFSDYWAYAIIDLIETLCKSADTAFKAKDLHQAWAVVAALGHFLNHRTQNEMWLCADDGDRVQLLSDLIGRTILTALDAVQQVGQLKRDSKFKDLGVVMASFFSAPSAAWEDIELVLEDVSETNWREAIVAYARKADIDLHNVGVAGIEGTLGKELPRPIEDGDKDWKFSPSLNSYWGYHMNRPIRGGRSFNICQWTRQEREKWHSDHEDPLKDFPEDVIKSGELVPA